MRASTGVAISALLFLATSAVSGCAIALPTLDPVKDRYLGGHYILAHEDGYPIALSESEGRVELIPPRDTEDIDQRVLAGIDRHAGRLWADAAPGARPTGPVLRLLVFAHGGLNGYQEDFARMRQLLAEPCADDSAPRHLFLSQDCGSARTGFYPIFVNWNSGLGDSILDDLFFVRFGQRHRWYGWLLSPFVIGTRLAESIFSAPSAWLASARTYWDGDPHGSELVESAAFLPVRALTTPVVQAFGTSAWRIMRRRADLVSTDRLEALRPPDGPPRPPRRGAARTLFAMLAGRIERCGDRACWKTRGDAGTGGPVEVTLLGHSMGAIVLNRLLVAPYPMPVKRVIYLAPAASVEEIEAYLRPYLAHPPDTGVGRPEFWIFTLTRHDEALERDWKTAVLPRGTLLTWVDNYFETVTEPGDNRAGRYRSHLEYYGHDAGPSAPSAAFTICQWDDGVDVRPTAHGAIDDLPYLEIMLRRAAPDEFRVPPVDGTPSPLGCRDE